MYAKHERLLWKVWLFVAETGWTGWKTTALKHSDGLIIADKIEKCRNALKSRHNQRYANQRKTAIWILICVRNGNWKRVRELIEWGQAVSEWATPLAMYGEKQNGKSTADNWRAHARTLNRSALHTCVQQIMTFQLQLNTIQQHYFNSSISILLLLVITHDL